MNSEEIVGLIKKRARRAPNHVESIREYLLHGHPVGDFLTALLSNQLVESYCKADKNNTALMSSWADWLWNDCPLEARGSPEKVAAWIEAGGVIGRE